MGSIPSNIGGFGVPIALNEQQQLQNISDQAALHMLQRKQLAEMYGNLASTPLPDRITDPNDPNYATSQAAYKAALDARAKGLEGAQKVYTPEHHASLFQHLHGLFAGTHKIDPVTGQVAPTGQGASSAATPAAPGAPNATPNGMAAVPSVAPSGSTAVPIIAAVQPTPTPAPTVDPGDHHPFATPGPDHPISKIHAGLNALRDHLKAAANPLPPEPSPDWQALAAAPNPGELAFERNKELWGIRGENALRVAQERTKALMASLQARPPRLLTQTTIPDLLDQMKVDPTMAIYGPNGNELSPAQLAEMPPNTIAREFRAGSQIFYALGDQNSKTLKVGNQVYDIPAIGAITPENSSALGVANVGATTTHQVPGMNPGEVVTLTGSHTPETTGMTPAPTSAPQPANPVLKRRPDGLAPVVPTLPAQSVNPGARAPGTAPMGAAVKSKPLATSMPPAFAPGTMLSQGRSAQPVVGAMSVMAANVFGGQNGEPPIWEYAKMYDNPALRTALNKALTLNALANPGTEDNPSFLQTLATGLGATGWSQEQINNANVEARQELERLGGPDAMKMFAREAALQEDLSALRTATKASAAQGSIRTLVRAAPVYNVSSSQNFRDQLGATLNTAAASMHGYPAINPEYVKWWDRGVSAAKGGPTSANVPKVSDATQRPANVPAGYVLRDGAKGRGWYAPTAK